MTDEMRRYMTKRIRNSDLFSVRDGQLACWSTVTIFVVVWMGVVGSDFFFFKQKTAYEISRMFAGSMFMLGAGYALSKGVHIRADFMYRNWSVRTQATIDLTLYLLFYFPGLIGASWACYKYAYKSWSIMERGMDTSWMPLLYPIKSVLYIGLVLFIIQGDYETLKCVYAVKNRRWP